MSNIWMISLLWASLDYGSAVGKNCSDGTFAHTGNFAAFPFRSRCCENISLDST
jgi:hypothetical protein